MLIHANDFTIKRIVSERYKFALLILKIMTDSLSKLSITLTLLSMFSFPGFAATGVDFKKLRPHSAGFFRLSHEYRTLKSVSLMNCLIQAQMDRHCKAISYNEIFRYCELNDKSGLYDEVDSTVAEGWITYNVINETVREGTGMYVIITKTRPCNILQFFTALKTLIFR